MSDKNTFSRGVFTSLARDFQLSANIFRQLGDGGLHSRYDVRGKVLERLVALQAQLERLEVMGDDEYRGFYFEVPRPTPEQWGNIEESIAVGDYKNEEEYHEEWRRWNPTETCWFHVSSTRHDEYRSLFLTDRKHTQLLIAGETPETKGRDHNDDGCYDEIFTRVIGYLDKLLEAIIADADGFNSYVAQNLPFQQRDGRIARKDFYRIAPRFRLKVDDRTSAIKALEDSANGRFLTPPFDDMTIRRYCKYFRIAHEVFDAEARRRDPKKHTINTPDDVPEDMRDVEYYKCVKLVRIDDSFDVDNPSDFKRLERESHYGELGFSRLDIGASDYGQSGWVITVSNRYSAYADTAINVATALYKAGAPLRIYDAEKLLKILLEEDNVGLVTRSFHDYMCHHEEGTVFQLPWEHECGDDEYSILTLEQYREMVSLAEWDAEETVRVK